MKYLYQIVVFLLFSNTVKAQNIESKKVSDKWIGEYSFSINSNNEDWRDEHIIILKVYKDSIIYEAKGYQLYEKYLLKVIEKENNLILKYGKAIDNTANELFLNKTKDFGILTKSKKKYLWNCPYTKKRFSKVKDQSQILKNKLTSK